ncbi:MAG: Ig-like domain-containing protein [Candidatus Scalindua sp.]|nr:Ig-like domain-containing protein [Candidatus Scalindua sp.]
MKKVSTHQKTRYFSNTLGFGLLTIFLPLLLLISNEEIVSAQSTLTWDPPQYVQNIAGYKVYYGNTSRNYVSSIDANNQTSLPLDFLIADNTYYLTVTSYNFSGIESSYANEVKFTNTVSGNQTPVAVGDSITTTEDNPVDINVIINDSDPDGTLVTSSVALVRFPSNGAAKNNWDGTITYTPDIGYSGTDSFTYTVQDDYGETSNEATETVTVSSGSLYFVDDFSTNTTGNYTVKNTWTLGGVGSYEYDSTGKRAQVLTGNNVALSFSRNLPVLDTGTFSMDFLPTTKYPYRGVINLYLRQDANTYYCLQNSDGYGEMFLKKVVDGNVVDIVHFSNQYSQNTNYTITIYFSPGLTTLDAFGEKLILNTNSSSIMVSSFEIVSSQQSAYYDNISYTHSKNTPLTQFSDNFSTSTTGNYIITNTWTKGGVGSFIYDSTGERAQVLTGDDVALSFSSNLPVLGTGTFSIDFRPTIKYPNRGIIDVYLRQDANTYYWLRNTDGYGAGSLNKVVGGSVVDSTSFSSQYSQNTNYTITINFSPGLTTVTAFGDVLTINSNKSSIMVGSFEIESTQQHAYYDNVLYAD